MDRVELRSKLMASRIEKFALAQSVEVYVRPLSALDRARYIDRCRALGKAKDTDAYFETMTKDTQCFIVCKGLVGETGQQIYADDEADKLIEEIPGEDLDALAIKITEISGIKYGQEERVKNSPPTPNADSSTVLQ